MDYQTAYKKALNNRVDYPPLVHDMLNKLFPEMDLSSITDGPLIRLDMMQLKNDFADKITLLQLREKWDQAVKDETDRILKSSGSIPIIIDGPQYFETYGQGKDKDKKWKYGHQGQGRDPDQGGW